MICWFWSVKKCLTSLKKIRQMTSVPNEVSKALKFVLKKCASKKCLK